MWFGWLKKEKIKRRWGEWGEEAIFLLLERLILKATLKALLRKGRRSVTGQEVVDTNWKHHSILRDFILSNYKSFVFKFWLDSYFNTLITAISIEVYMKIIKKENMVIWTVPQIRFCDVLSLSRSSVSVHFSTKSWNWIVCCKKCRSAQSVPASCPFEEECRKFQGIDRMS